MKNIIFFSLCMLALSTGYVSCTQTEAVDTTTSVVPGTYSHEAVLRGEYLVTIMGCNDCHSPKKFGPKGPEPDPELLLSGHPQQMTVPKVDTTEIGTWVLFNAHNTAVVGPWGVSFAANLTSDATGIGNWTEEQFFRALREGKAKGLANNRDILPPMPWPMFSHATDEDIRAIFAYLKTVAPVRNVPPNPMSLKEISLN